MQTIGNRTTTFGGFYFCRMSISKRSLIGLILIVLFVFCFFFHYDYRRHGTNWCTESSARVVLSTRRGTRACLQDESFKRQQSTQFDPSSRWRWWRHWCCCWCSCKYSALDVRRPRPRPRPRPQPQPRSRTKSGGSSASGPYALDVRHGRTHEQSPPRRSLHVERRRGTVIMPLVMCRP